MTPDDDTLPDLTHVTANNLLRQRYDKEMRELRDLRDQLLTLLPQEEEQP